MDRESLFSDLTPFNDIGSRPIKVAETAKEFTVRMTKDSLSLKLSITRDTGRIKCKWGAKKDQFFGSFQALLSSDVFANLRRWADAQRDLLRQEEVAKTILLPVHGSTHDGSSLESVEEIDTLTGSSEKPHDATEVLLIDGPAGIGKTSLIEQLALKRAETYKQSQKPLILHVKSRGRVLSNLQDLMAFSLQTIRSHITYDQIPVIAKHGLVVIAIDGFDELADPNGYEMAWAQLGELVTFVRGKGTLILAGRDTFLGRSRLLSDVKALREGVDLVHCLTLYPPTPDQAKEWLLKHQPWKDTDFEIPSISVLLEDGSFALRPVFLKILASRVKPKELRDKHERYLTPLLVSQMIRREAELFGDPVNAVMSTEKREAYILEFLCEVARQMADSQVEALDASEISWISEVTLGDNVSDNILGLIRNRATVVAFFVNDERAGYRTFLHSHLFNYFLSKVIIDSIAQRDIPKFIRRNLLGSETLSVFADVASESSVSSRERFTDFWNYASSLSMSYIGVDRGLRNVGALALAALPAVTSERPISLRDFKIDVALLSGTCPETRLEDMEIAQLDCRGADLSSVTHSNVSILSLIADETVRISPSFPIPKKLFLARTESGATEITGIVEITEWLGTRGRDSSVDQTAGLVSASLRELPIYILLRRAARLHQYWLRSDSDDNQTCKIVNDPNWSILSDILRDHDYLRVETRQAAGKASRFYHIKHRESILIESPEDMRLTQLYERLKSLE
jgi:hypothetical protein